MGEIEGLSGTHTQSSSTFFTWHNTHRVLDWQWSPSSGTLSTVLEFTLFHFFSERWLGRYALSISLFNRHSDKMIACITQAMSACSTVLRRAAITSTWLWRLRFVWFYAEINLYTLTRSCVTCVCSFSVRVRAFAL